MAKKAVVLLSGGIDSTTTLAIARAEGYDLYALSFHYGQRHEIELHRAREIARAFGALQHLVIRINMRELPDAAAFDLHLITHREIYHTKSRTVADYWLLDLLPENAVLMNPWDAARLGLEDGDQVKIVSATNPEGVWDLKNGRKVSMIGRVKIVQGIRPGVISFALGFGHWAVGASDVWIDGVRIPGDPRRARGVHANAAMRVDEYLKNTCLVDPIGGSVSFYDTRVRVVKVT